jgi:hypothetical protein
MIISCVVSGIAGLVVWGAPMKFDGILKEVY